MRSTPLLFVIACAELLIGCATSIPPAELVEARQAYKHASAGQAAHVVPEDLHKAQTALAMAERSFRDAPSSFRTRDLAYVADRKAKTAEALAAAAAENVATAEANGDYRTAQTEIVRKTKGDPATSGRTASLKTEQLAAEHKARLVAEKKAFDADADLVRLAAVKEEARGLVITLPGGVLFASDKSELLPAAQNRLNRVADALMATRGRKLTVEGHTDSQGSSSYNQKWSQQRANAVRLYFISRGYPGELIQSWGIGEDRPVADNASAGGRANNRRIEIIIDRAAK